MPETLEEIRKRLEDVFGRVDETALIVLKGHLLIEETLETIISTFLFHPDWVAEARLSFSQKLNIARSMSLDEHDNAMWYLAVKLNTLRNELAHALNSSKRAAKTKAVIDTYFELAGDTPQSEKLREQAEHLVLAFAVSFFLGFLATFLDEVKRFREHVSALDAIVNPHRHKPGSTQ